MELKAHESTFEETGRGRVLPRPYALVTAAYTVGGWGCRRKGDCHDLLKQYESSITISTPPPD